MSRFRRTRQTPTRTSRPRFLTPAAVLGLLLLLVACADGASPILRAGGASGTSDASDPADAEAGGGGPLQVVVTTSILRDVVETLVQDDGEVVVMIPPGVDPHAFEPSAQTVAALRGADLVVANGLWLEASLVGALDAAAQDGVNVLEVAGHLDPIPMGAHVTRAPGDDAGTGHDHDGHDHDGHDHDGHDHDRDDHDGHDHDGHDHDHGDLDPHFWFDPTRMATATALIADELAALDSDVEAAQWRQRAQEYGQQLHELDQQLVDEFARIPDERRRLVTNHDALGYLADRYDFEVLGTVIPGAATHAAADAAGFAALVETVEDAHLPAIFTETTTSNVLAEQLATEVNARTDLEVEVIGLTTDALGAPGSGAETYPDLLRTNARLIADALSDASAARR